MPSRRTWMLSSLAAGGALVVGWALVPPRQRRLGAQPLPVQAGEAAFNGWVKIAQDGSVWVQCPKSEMGQGVHTGLAMLLADELDADWARVRVQHPPLDAIYNNQAAVVDGLPFHPDDDGALKQALQWLTAKAMREAGVMMTGGSSSLKDLWLPMREAGASARAMLRAAAAQRFGVNADDCQVAAGRVTHPAGHAAGFGELAEAAARLPLPPSVVLKPPAAFKLIGQPLRRLAPEAQAKATGAAGFGIDVRPPGLRFAAVRMCPTLGGGVARVDGSAALQRPGVLKLVTLAGHHGGTAGVAVVATSTWLAQQALQSVQVQWDEAVPAAQFDSATALQRMRQALDTERGFAFYDQGDADAALAGAARVLQADYTAPWLAHAALEPMNCTVLLEPGRATVWAPTQVPGLARRAAARVLGLAAEDVTVHVTLLGGGFGRRLEVDFVAQAAEVARALPGTPVQTLWSRADDMQHDFYRPACAARFRAGLDAQGRLLGLSAVSVGQAVVPAFVQRQFGLPAGGPDKTSAEGSFDQPYAWPAARIAHHNLVLPMPVGFWRSVGHSHQAFFKECFVDELAAAAGADPVAYRLDLLRQQPRHAAVLRLAADKAAWGQSLAPAADGAPRARGVALHHSFGSVVAQVAEVSLDAQRRIRVHRVVCAVDCGTPINPNLIAQQMESGIVFGLGAALHGEITVVQGRVQQSHFADQPSLRLPECPAIEVHMVPSTAHPEGVGEPGTPPIAPAVANALAALTGQRLRALPLRLADPTG